jgi:zinc D-Ala-D-Ala dipeptidase
MSIRSIASRLFACAALIVAAATMSAPDAAAQPTAPREFVSLADFDPTILREIRYFTPHNFTGDPVDGYLAPMCILTRPAAEALRRAQQEFLEQGWCTTAIGRSGRSTISSHGRRTSPTNG